MALASKRAATKLPKDVNRILYVKNLPYKISSEEMYDVFGRYGAIRQIRIGTKPETKGTAFVVYEDIFDAKNAVDHLSGFNVMGRYLTVLYYQSNKGHLAKKPVDLEGKKKNIAQMKEQLGE
jgi:pre-mRNA branch site protein p14